MTVSSVCRRLDLSRASFYEARRRRQRRRIDEAAVLELVDAERRLQPRLGTRKLLVVIGPELEAMGIQMGRDRLFELLKRHERLVKRKVSRPRTTQVNWQYPIEPNRLKALTVDGPNQAWASDLTYVRCGTGWRYVSLITDVFSRKIVGYALWKHLGVEGPLSALSMALEALPEGARPLHHSDRGCQYTSNPYRAALAEAGMPVSMTEVNHCYENALAERVNGILKHEYGLVSEFIDEAQARRTLDQAVTLYNTRRPHASLGYRLPEEVHRAVA